MNRAHPIRCDCGTLRGTLAHGAWSNRVICYCDDCQAFAEALGRAGETLDVRGGSDIVQTGPSYLAFTEGREQLACLRVTPKGPLRWYAACCNTPIGNTPANPRFNFVGLLHDCLGDTATIDASFGAPRMVAFPRYARGEPKPKLKVPVTAAAAFLCHVAVGRISGAYRRTPFFDHDGRPVAEPTLTPAVPSV